MAGTRKKITVNTSIEDGKVIHASIGDEDLSLTGPIPLEKFSDFVDKLEALSEYIDFGGQSGWRTEEIEMFLWGYITEKARKIFRLLALEGGWVRRDKIQNSLNIRGRALAGVLSSPGQYFSRFRKEPLYEREKRREENDDDQYYYYRIQPKYLADIREAFEIE